MITEILKKIKLLQGDIDVILEQKKKSFTSPIDFFIRLGAALKLPTFYATFRTVDSVLREKILLTVSIINDCSG